MASFTFEAGNTRALARVPRYALGWIASLLVPRTSGLWVFGSGIGLGEGALALHRLARDRVPRTRLVWLASTPDELAEAQAMGIDAVAKHSRLGLWLTLRARVLVVTHGMGDVNRYGVRGGFVVQLWHGIPLKRLHLDSPVALRSGLSDLLPVRALLRRGYRVIGAQIALFPVSSRRLVSRIASGFGVARDRIVVTGDPRDDVLLAGDPAERRTAAAVRLTECAGPVPPGARVVLYAPTWRDGQPDPSVPDDAIWDELAEWLERSGAVLLIRTHPLGSGDYAPGADRSPRIRLIGRDVLADVTPLLPAVDALITDYSSIAYDYALVGGPIVFLAPDIATYAHSRGLYEPYREFSGGRHVVTWPHVLEQLDEIGRDDTEARAHSAWLREEHFDQLDGRATERVLAEIQRRIGLSGSPPLAAPPIGRPVITALRFDGDRLVVGLDPAGRELCSVRLQGARGYIEAIRTATAVEFPLLAARWGVPDLAPPSGDYRLTLLGSTVSTRVAVDVPELPVAERELYRATVLADDGGLLVRIAPPLTAGERGPRAWRALSAAYRHTEAQPENAVLFESFYSRSASDNPLGIDRALARSHPEVRRYWSVLDGSIAVPPGAIRVVQGSREWWRVRADARVLVINDWLRFTYRPRPHQHVLQTWHGTMLKRLALDRPDTSSRMRVAIVRQQRRWDALLAQNDYSAKIFRTSYAYAGPIWASGYPRNDVLADPGRAALVRAAIGIPDGVRAVLYAPTWRDDRSEMVDYLDVVDFAADLPEDHVLLVRGHSRTLEFGQDLRAARLVDVTSYPDFADLMLVADLLVTDYSSVMFDFAGTGRPIIFFTPDLTHYSDTLRGFYFDLLAEAPGPVVSTRSELLTAIASADSVADKYLERREQWRGRFAPHDDGGAGDRVVARLYDEGWLG